MSSPIESAPTTITVLDNLAIKPISEFVGYFVREDGTIWSTLRRRGLGSILRGDTWQTI